MKKLLSSKKNYDEKIPKTFSLMNSPKMTITSSWLVRNDSANINSILQPDYHKTCQKKNSNKGVYRKCLLSDNTCYCKDKKIKPKLMSRSKSCLALDEVRSRCFIADLWRKPSRPMKDCVCKEDVVRSRAGSVRLMSTKARQDLVDCCSCLKYTPSRLDYQAYREEQGEEDLRELQNYNQVEYEDKEGDHGPNEDEAKKNNEETPEEETKKNNEEIQAESYSLSTIVGTRTPSVTTKTTSTETSEVPGETSTDLGAFRKDHYFETHSTEDLAKDTPHHTCVHRFRLDDRLLPEPLNADPYGRSRCTVCTRPMEGDTMQLSKSYFQDRPTAATLRKVSRWSELGLGPRSVCVGGSKSQVELQLGHHEKAKMGMFVGRMRRPQYFNTYALRQQRLSR